MNPEPPPVVDQDDLPRGVWRMHRLQLGLARAHWDSGSSAEPTVQLLSQPHPEGVWKVGAGRFMTWTPNTPDEEETGDERGN